MAGSGIAKTAARLRWAVWIVWGAILIVYAIGRLGLSLGPVQVVSRTEVAAGPGRVPGAGRDHARAYT